MKRRSWTPEQLVEAVASSTSYRQALSKLGLVEAGGNYEQVKKYITEQQLNITHFKGHAWNKGMHGLVFVRPAPLNRVLRRNVRYTSYKLKMRLFAAGLKKPWCEICSWSEQSADGYLPLELDHINGDHLDNRLSNLRILCPNCHSMQPTYRARNRRLKSAQVVERDTRST